VSSEGVRSAVWQVGLPAVVAQRMQPAAPAPSPSPSASPRPDNGKDPNGGTERQNRWLMWSIPAVIILGAVGIGFGLRRRSE